MDPVLCAILPQPGVYNVQSYNFNIPSVVTHGSSTNNISSNTLSSILSPSPVLSYLGPSNDDPIKLQLNEINLINGTITTIIGPDDNNEELSQAEVRLEGSST
jgi:hypothetical protein